MRGGYGRQGIIFVVSAMASLLMGMPQLEAQEDRILDCRARHCTAAEIVQFWAPSKQPADNAAGRDMKTRGYNPTSPPSAPSSRVPVTEVPAAEKKRQFIGVNFDTNSAVVPERYYKDLDEQAKAMQSQQLQQATLALDGYTDNRGPLLHNLTLSEKRAASVRAYLVGKGVEPRRIRIQGHGPANPINTNATDSGRFDNRRVVLDLQQ